MEKKTPYSRPSAKVAVIYPKNIREQLTHEDINLQFTPGDAAKLAVSLTNAVGMVQKRGDKITVRIRLKDNQVSVVLPKR
ncbi:MAG: hypothetical protein ACFFER_04965 [Candidatus Thorarchaeota archaeon]